jgi:hypothetical protein
VQGVGRGGQGLARAEHRGADLDLQVAAVALKGRRAEIKLDGEQAILNQHAAERDRATDLRATFRRVVQAKGQVVGSVGRDCAVA